MAIVIPPTDIAMPMQLMRGTIVDMSVITVHGYLVTRPAVIVELAVYGALIWKDGAQLLIPWHRIDSLEALTADNVADRTAVLSEPEREAMLDAARSLGRNYR